MKVKLYQATLTIEGKEQKLTKAIAKQFPVMPFSTRSCLVHLVNEPIAKISAHVLGLGKGWLYLVEDSEMGLRWEPPIEYFGSPERGEGARVKGYNVDTPNEVPTIYF